MASLLKKVQKADLGSKIKGGVKATRQSLSSVKSKAGGQLSQAASRAEEQFSKNAGVVNNYDKYLQNPVVLEGKIWKRRSGMAKYRHRSQRNAWELRRFELRGTTLLYYNLPPGEEDEIIFDGGLEEEEEEEEGEEEGEAKAANNTATSISEESVKSAAWKAADENETSTTTTDSNQPRGHLDFKEEKALVHASMGHQTGAPSPFCLSIVVGMSHEHTKWKLSFEDQSSMMEWLAALTNVVVQCSVDGYNVQLLHAANPNRSGANQKAPAEPAFLRRPPVYEPQQSSESKQQQSSKEEEGEDGDDDDSPSSKIAPSHHRLWMTQDYIVRSSSASASSVVVEQGSKAETSQIESTAPGYTAALQKVELQHKKELEQRAAAYTLQLRDLQEKIIELTTTAAETQAQHNQEVKELQKEVKEFAKFAGRGGDEDKEEDEFYETM